MSDQETASGRGPVVLFASPHFGHGSDELGGILVRSFLKTLKELRPAPEALIFVNAGVQLTTEGSELIEDIRSLAEQGSPVLSWIGSASMSARSSTVGPCPLRSSPTTPVPPTPSVTS